MCARKQAIYLQLSIVSTVKHASMVLRKAHGKETSLLSLVFA